MAVLEKPIFTHPAVTSGMGKNDGSASFFTKQTEFKTKNPEVRYNNSCDPFIICIFLLLHLNFAWLLTQTGVSYSDLMRRFKIKRSVIVMCEENEGILKVYQLVKQLKLDQIGCRMFVDHQFFSHATDSQLGL